MSYFSMENNKFSGKSTNMAIHHLTQAPKPLIYGLFTELGRPLVFLSDALELQTAVMVVQALSLAALDWTDPIHDILSHPQLRNPPTETLSPEQILGRVAYDGRLSGLMKAGPGFHGVSRILSNPNASAAVLHYVHQLDHENLDELLSQLSQLSALLLCGTHKPDKPAFDFYLSHIPVWVCSLRVVLGMIQDKGQKLLLVRGVWLLIVLVYITQLRPTVDPTLLASQDLPEEASSWAGILSDIRNKGGYEEKYLDLQLLRTIRSLFELSKSFDGIGKPHVRAAGKLVTQWQRWTGLGGEKEETLNIRL